jgi:16S rRNA (uracil1498-N3)-methyltransferase
MELFFVMYYVQNIEDLALNKDESRHCHSVLRQKTGDTIMVFDGKGCFAQVELTSVGKICKYHIKQIQETKRSESSFSIAIAPPKKSNRFDFLLEKLTELGIQKIYLISTQHSERNRINEDRALKQIIAACKQAKVYVIPEVFYNVRLEKLIESDANLLLCHCNEEYDRITLDSLSVDSSKNESIFLIGPEGDFSSNEIEAFMNAGAQQIDLGENRLRTETAAMFIASWIKLKNQKGLTNSLKG